MPKYTAESINSRNNYLFYETQKDGSVLLAMRICRFLKTYSWALIVITRVKLKVADLNTNLLDIFPDCLVTVTAEQTTQTTQPIIMLIITVTIKA